MEGGDGFTQVNKGGGQQKKGGKQIRETPLPSIVDNQKAADKKKNQQLYNALAQGKEEAEDAAELERQAAERAAKQKAMMAAFMQAEADSDEDKHHKKGKGKKQQQDKKQRQQRKKKGKQSDDEEEDQEPTATTAVTQDDTTHLEEEKVSAQLSEKPTYPLEVVYCQVCGIPPEYCMHDKKDSSECKAWLLKTHPALFEQIYGPIEEATETTTATEGQKPQKKKKKVSLAPTGDSDIVCYKAQRRGKKILTTVVGLHHYGVNLKDMSKIMGKFFACGGAVADDDKHGQCIQLQGDIEGRFEEFCSSQLAKYQVPFERVKFEQVKKKKKAEGAQAAGDEDDEDEA